MATITPHEVSIDHTAADGIDSEAFAAFCITTGCTWRGDWQHAEDDYPAAEAELDAKADGDEHIEETSAVQAGLLIGTASDGAAVTIAAFYRS